MNNLFEDNGAEFSDCKKYRYCLWRIWDKDLPLLMVVGLNPSTANADTNDQTISKVRGIAKYNGFGGFYMVNCFPYISTDPDEMNDVDKNRIADNDARIEQIARDCSTVVFAWGRFDIVAKMGRDKDMIEMFPNAKCLAILKNGNPKHPLMCAHASKLIPYIK